LSGSDEEYAGRAALERLSAELSARDTERETRAMLEIAKIQARRDEATAALAALERIFADLWRRITSLVPSAIEISPWHLSIEDGHLTWEIAHDHIDEGSFDRSGWDVIAGAQIRIRQAAPKTDYPGMSASLWAVRRPGTTNPEWFEVAYNAEEGNAPAEEPFALKDLTKVDLIASGGMTNLYAAHGPIRIDGLRQDMFCDRWMGFLADAALGHMKRPDPPDASQRTVVRADGTELQATGKNPLQDRLRRASDA
jgi:serine/threonine-protein kinase